jgi:hypothetical protein
MAMVAELDDPALRPVNSYIDRSSVLLPGPDARMLTALGVSSALNDHLEEIRLGENAGGDLIFARAQPVGQRHLPTAEGYLVAWNCDRLQAGEHLNSVTTRACYSPGATCNDLPDPPTRRTTPAAWL